MNVMAGLMIFGLGFSTAAWLWDYLERREARQRKGRGW